jgi:hypothetical protein
LAQPAVHSRRGCNRDSTTTETAARAIRINTPPYASSVSARRVPDSSAGRSNDTRLMHAHRPRLLARPSQAIPCQGSTLSSASTKTQAVLSGPALQFAIRPAFAKPVFAPRSSNLRFQGWNPSKIRCYDSIQNFGRVVSTTFVRVHEFPTGPTNNSERASCRKIFSQLRALVLNKFNTQKFSVVLSRNL